MTPPSRRDKMDGMDKILLRRKKNAGLPPGTVRLPEAVNGSTPGPYRITVINYDASQHNETVTTDLDQAVRSIEKSNATWIHMENPGSAEVVERLGEVFGIHPLYLEDMLHLDQRPKLEEQENLFFLVFRHFEWTGDALHEEQISLILGKNYLLTLQNSGNPVFRVLQERLAAGRGMVRSRRTDYLMYALLDVVIDNYFAVIETLGERMELLEEELLSRPDRGTERELYTLKNRILQVQKGLTPMREIIFSLRRSESRLISRDNHPFFSDLSDHILQLVESLSTYREVLSNMFDAYLSSQNNRLSEVMKVLTLISTIFIPLSFITGIFGMNFENMPILRQGWGYPAVIGAMALTGIGMIIYFKIRRWF